MPTIVNIGDVSWSRWNWSPVTGRHPDSKKYHPGVIAACILRNSECYAICKYNPNSLCLQMLQHWIFINTKARGFDAACFPEIMKQAELWWEKLSKRLLCLIKGSKVLSFKALVVFKTVHIKHHRVPKHSEVRDFSPHN